MPSEPSGLRTWSSRTVIQSLRYTSREAMRWISSTRQVCRAIAGNLAHVLLASLNPAAVAGGADIGDAVRIDGAVLSRSDLVGAATSVAERVGGAQRVAVLAKPTATTVLAVTGCLIAGVPVVPVPADVGAAERRHILTDSGAQVWLGERPDEPEGLPHIPVRLHARSWHRYQEPPPEATALIMYTSGTTGPPKGVLMSRRAIAAGIDALAEAWQWTPDDILVHGLPLFHIHGLVLGLLGSLRIGNRFVHTGKPKPAEYAAAEDLSTSQCRRCGRGSSMTPTSREHCHRPGCWCREARRCRCRSSTNSPNSPATHPSSGTAPAKP